MRNIGKLKNPQECNCYSGYIWEPSGFALDSHQPLPDNNV